jgi:hypothetical protein
MKTFKTVQKIVSKEKFAISEQEFNDIMKVIRNGEGSFDINKSKRFACALLNNPQVPMIEKENTLNSLISSGYNVSHNILIPMLCFGNKINLKNLSSDMCELIVNNIDWGDFEHEFRTYIKNNPGIKALPFNNTELEKCLFEKVLKESETGNHLPLSAYEIIEFISDTKLLDKVINNRHSQSPMINSALVNNDNLSYEDKELLLETDIIIKRIKNCSPEKAKEFYDSIIYPLTQSYEKDITDIALSSLYNLVNHNLLPETCEIDLMRRFLNKELDMNVVSCIDILLRKTTNETVLNEVLKINNTILVMDVLENPNTPNDIIVKIAEKFIMDKQDLYKKSPWSNWDAETCNEFVLKFTKLPFPATQCRNLVRYVSSDKYEKIMQMMCLNNYLPKNIQQEIIMFSNNKDLSRTFAFFNQEINEKLPHEKSQKFLDTIGLIYNKISNTDTVLDINQSIFNSNLAINVDPFVPTDPSELKIIDEILDKAITKIKAYHLPRMIAYQYKEIIAEKEIDNKAEAILRTYETENVSDEVLKKTKDKIEEIVFSGYTDYKKGKTLYPPTCFDDYIICEKIDEYLELYQDINTKLNRNNLIQDSHNLSIDNNELVM